MMGSLDLINSSRGLLTDYVIYWFFISIGTPPAPMWHPMWHPKTLHPETKQGCCEFTNLANADTLFLFIISSAQIWGLWWTRLRGQPSQWPKLNKVKIVFIWCVQFLVRNKLFDLFIFFVWWSFGLQQMMKQFLHVFEPLIRQEELELC
jgi:hypothetical protein